MYMYTFRVTCNEIAVRAGQARVEDSVAHLCTRESSPATASTLPAVERQHVQSNYKHVQRTLRLDSAEVSFNGMSKFSGCVWLLPCTRESKPAMANTLPAARIAANNDTDL
jgi:hypothetical protein